ncbi:MAG: hypothetical protein MI923_18035 [Phycisphaerales bacterium]|nr:hypothetical protein [Phycisphaerales bacterium]
MTDKIPKYIEKLHSHIRNTEDELDKLYYKIHKAEEDLAAMRHKQSLMKMYLKNLKEMNDDIALAALLQKICADTTNEN